MVTRFERVEDYVAQLKEEARVSILASCGKHALPASHYVHIGKQLLATGNMHMKHDDPRAAFTMYFRLLVLLSDVIRTHRGRAALTRPDAAWVEAMCGEVIERAAAARDAIKADWNAQVAAARVHRDAHGTASATPRASPPPSIAAVPTDSGLEALPSATVGAVPAAISIDHRAEVEAEPMGPPTLPTTHPVTTTHATAPPTARATTPVAAVPIAPSVTSPSPGWAPYGTLSTILHDSSIQTHDAITAKLASREGVEISRTSVSWVGDGGGGGGVSWSKATATASHLALAPTTKLRSITVPQDLIGQFAAIAEPNNRMGARGIETCGVLAGFMKAGRCYVTDLVIPKQRGDEDNCEMLNEDELLSLCLAKGLITLGWIHTHPSQRCFMSSMDQHTHFGYQAMLPEAVAIVVAPTDPVCPFALFRLTDAPGASGLDFVQQCQLRGFHPHEADFAMVEHCSHCVFSPDLVTSVTDLR